MMTVRVHHALGMLLLLAAQVAATPPDAAGGELSVAEITRRLARFGVDTQGFFEREPLLALRRTANGGAQRTHTLHSQALAPPAAGQMLLAATALYSLAASSPPAPPLPLLGGTV